MIKEQYGYLTQQHILELNPSGKSYRAVLGDRSVDVEILRAEDGKFDLLVEL